MKNNKESVLVVVLITLVVLLIGAGFYYKVKNSDSILQNTAINNHQPDIQNKSEIVSGVNSKIKNDDTCPPSTPQQTQTYANGKPFPGKYQFVLDFNHDELKCVGNSWGGDFPGCDNLVSVTTTLWHKGDVVNSCVAFYEDKGSDTGWGIGLVSDSNIRVPLRYVKKVSDTTPVTKY